MKKIIIILVILIGGCSTDNSQKVKTNLIAKPLTEDVKLPLKADVSFIQLETTDECLLSYIMSIEVTQDYIFVLDRNTFYVFSSTGKFIKKLKRGHGPGEITRAIAFAVSNEYKEIYINEQGDILHIYDYDMNYKTTYVFEKGTFIDLVKIDNDNFLMYNFLPPKYGARYLLAKYNMNIKKITNEYIPNNNILMKDLSIRLNDNFFLNDKNDIVFIASNSRKIYTYKNDSVSTLYSLDFGNFEPPASFIERFDMKKLRKFRKEALGNNYVSFLYYAYDFKEFLLVGLQHKKYNCGICFKGDNILYLTTLSDLFGLPESPSFNIINNARENKVYFIYDNDILLNDDIKENEKVLTIKGESIKIQDNNNPVIIELTIK